MLKIVTDDTDHDDLAGALDVLVSEGARRMLMAGLEAGVADYIARHQQLVDAEGRRLVVVNGKAAERPLVTGAGALKVPIMFGNQLVGVSRHLDGICSPRLFLPRVSSSASTRWTPRGQERQICLPVEPGRRAEYRAGITEMGGRSAVRADDCSARGAEERLQS